MILVWCAVFIVLSITIFFMLRFWKIKSVALTFIIVHFVFVLGITLSICKNIYSPQIEFTWFILMFLDRPVMSLYDSFTSLIEQIAGNTKIVKAIVAPGMFFITLGSIQYYFIGKLIDYFVSWMFPSKFPSQVLPK